MVKIKDIPKVDRPREKLIKSGAKFLKDYELLAIRQFTLKELNQAVFINQ